ncbi:hypothetical protein PF005_g23974 [Phytophthora fragariae]|uniref:Uncharacterized protein n=1 Tax=Phytophthora fragariae TaxID=53985 RepID=A0A6A3W3W9_9STRA|nr:hypothetical protein PF004_g27000 [Phytophthora fragariae]KAE9178692.1 hypothetical protein PF005_g23974 [Phytophthora fragariae]KAE9289522.1 hypothetical protein PF001_g20001 [Phytophthora fragariae]
MLHEGKRPTITAVFIFFANICAFICDVGSGSLGCNLCMIAVNLGFKRVYADILAQRVSNKVVNNNGLKLDDLLCVSFLR